MTNKGLQGRGGHNTQSWETNVKDCRAKQLGDECEGLQTRGGTRKEKKEDKADTVTNKKGDNNGDKKKGDKTDTMTYKTGDKGRQEGRQADTMTNKKGDKRKQKGDKTDAITRRETRPETKKD